MAFFEKYFFAVGDDDDDDNDDDDDDDRKIKVQFKNLSNTPSSCGFPGAHMTLTGHPRSLPLTLKRGRELRLLSQLSTRGVASYLSRLEPGADKQQWQVIC